MSFAPRDIYVSFGVSETQRACHPPRDSRCKRALARGPRHPSDRTNPPLRLSLLLDTQGTQEETVRYLADCVNHFAGRVAEHPTCETRPYGRDGPGCRSHVFSCWDAIPEQLSDSTLAATTRIVTAILFGRRRWPGRWWHRFTISASISAMATIVCTDGAVEGAVLMIGIVVVVVSLRQGTSDRISNARLTWIPILAQLMALECTAVHWIIARS